MKGRRAIGWSREGGGEKEGRGGRGGREELGKKEVEEEGGEGLRSEGSTC